MVLLVLPPCQFHFHLLIMCITGQQNIQKAQNCSMDFKKNNHLGNIASMNKGPQGFISSTIAT